MRNLSFGCLTTMKLSVSAHPISSHISFILGIPAASVLFSPMIKNFPTLGIMRTDTDMTKTNGESFNYYLDVSKIKLSGIV